MSVDTHPVEVDVWVGFGQLFNDVLGVGQRIIAQVAVTVAVEVPSAQGRTAARCYVDDDESQFGQ